MTLFILLMTMVFRLGFLQSVGTSNVANLVSSLGAVAVFIAHGAIDWPIGLAMAASMAAGGWAGSTFSLKVGNRWARRIFFGAILLMAFRLITGWPDLTSWLDWLLH